MTGKKNTASRLKELMSERGLNQTDLLNACNRVCRQLHEKEITKSAMSYYVRGKVEPKQDKLYIMAKAFDVTPSWLMGHDDGNEQVNASDEARLVNIYKALNAAGKKQLMLQAVLLSESAQFMEEVEP